jgi:hypothetical protein
MSEVGQIRRANPPSSIFWFNGRRSRPERSNYLNVRGSILLTSIALPLAPASKTKIKSSFSVLYIHAIRYEWLTFSPISKVRTSSKPLREKDVLSPEEFQSLPQVKYEDL